MGEKLVQNDGWRVSSMFSRRLTSKKGILTIFWTARGGEWNQCQKASVFPSVNQKDAYRGTTFRSLTEQNDLTLFYPTKWTQGQIVKKWTEMFLYFQSCKCSFVTDVGDVLFDFFKEANYVWDREIIWQKKTKLNYPVRM